MTMTLDEMFALQEQSKKTRKKPVDREHQLQCACIRWFRYQYPELREILFAVPNGGHRSASEASKFKEEGVVSGLSDLILLKGNGIFCALCIEMKTDKGTQSEKQKEWQQTAEKHGNKYVLCRNLDQFMKAVNDYLHGCKKR